MRISDWSSDVCSSDLTLANQAPRIAALPPSEASVFHSSVPRICLSPVLRITSTARIALPPTSAISTASMRSEEHTSELQSLMRISYAVFCLKKKTTTHKRNNQQQSSHMTHHTSYIHIV